MIKSIFLVLFIFAAGGIGFVSARDAKPVAGVPPKPAKKETHLRIIRLEDRIRNQRERIDEGIKDKVLSPYQAQTCLGVLDSVEKKMEADYKAKGPRGMMKKEQYDAYNASLDKNSATIKEGKRYYYQYGPYIDYGRYYRYYYDPFPPAGTPAPQVPVLEREHPGIFEIKDRIKDQQERIDQGLKNNKLTKDEVKACRRVLAAVKKKLRADYKANGSKKMKLTREQYDALNTSLDVNSAIIQEDKRYFYFYGPYYYDEYGFWE